MKNIPISAAKELSEKYNLDQVVIIARRIDTDKTAGREFVTTYGKDRANCTVAATIGAFITDKIMKWEKSK
jgi:hypothetical protein